MNASTASGSLAIIIRAQREHIMQDWEEHVRVEIDAARTQGRIALRDHLPSFLSRLADTLDPKLPLESACEHTAICETHGKERADLLQYTIPQVLHEYHILRNTVFEVLESESGPLAKADRNAILKSFDGAAREAADAFMDERTERERAKRRDVEVERDLTQQQLNSLEADADIQKKFLATLTHDLRNPIGSIKMALDLLLREISRTSDIDVFVDIITRNIAHAETMLLDLLDANRIKSGHKLPLNVEACDLTNLAKVILAELSAVQGRGCILEARDDIRGFWCTDRLRRVISNLVDNAVKYGEPNGSITLFLEQTVEGTTIKVHNDGVPISAVDQATIFEPYYRASESGGKRVIGWGLGLTLVKAVAEAHGGSVRVKSEHGTGTTFVVTLPNDSRPFQS